jgi:type IV pilus assembly protein PilC
MAVYVMPQMKELYAGFNAKLPWITEMMLSLSDLVVKYGFFLLIFILLTITGIRYWIKSTNQGRYTWDTIKIKTPVINKFLMQVYSARFARTMSGLIGSGVSIMDSLSITSRAVGNVLYRDFLIAASEKVKGGIPLSTPMKAGILFPPIVAQMLLVGEQTGEIDNMLSRLADFFDEEVDNAVKSITSIMEPYIIVVMGGIVALILIAIMMPIYNIGKII